MAILSLAEFQDVINISEWSISPSENTAFSRSQSGVTRRVTSGISIWEGYLIVGNKRHSDSREAAAAFEEVMQAGTFFAFSPYQSKGAKGPKNYTGSGLGNVRTNGTQVAGRDLKLKNLPANFEFVRGDFISFVSNGVDRLYRVSTTARATAAGLVTLKLNLPLPPTLPANDTPIECVRPKCTMGYLPGSYQASAFINAYSPGGATIQFYQELGS